MSRKKRADASPILKVFEPAPAMPDVLPMLPEPESQAVPLVFENVAEVLPAVPEIRLKRFAVKYPEHATVMVDATDEAEAVRLAGSMKSAHEPKVWEVEGE